MNRHRAACSRTTWTAAGVALLLVLVAPAGWAASGASEKTPPPISRHNLTFGGFAAQASSELELDGQPALTSSRGFGPALLGLDLGFHERLLPAFSIGVRGNVIPFPMDHRSDRYHLGLGVEPRLWPVQLGPAYFYAAVPLGLSWVAVNAQPNRAFSREISYAGSYFVGITLGVEVTLGKPGRRVYAELGYAAHRTALEARVISRVSELPSTVERWHYTDRVLRVELGGSFGFGPL